MPLKLAARSSNFGEAVLISQLRLSDSSVAAYLLSQDKYDVEGIFMKNWEEDDQDECNS